MNANAAPQSLSRTYCVLFAIATGAALSAGAYQLGLLEGFFALYLLILGLSAVPFALSRMMFKSGERSWAVLITYVAFCIAGSTLYPLGLVIPFAGWPVFHAMRRSRSLKRSNAAGVSIPEKGAAGNTASAQRPRMLGKALALSAFVLAGFMALATWWALHGETEVRREVAAFCHSVNIGDDTTGMDQNASAAMKRPTTWNSMGDGGMQLVVDRYSAFSRRGCTITAAGGKVTGNQKWRYALKSIDGLNLRS